MTTPNDAEIQNIINKYSKAEEALRHIIESANVMENSINELSRARADLKESHADQKQHMKSSISQTENLLVSINHFILDFKKVSSDLHSSIVIIKDASTALSNLSTQNFDQRFSDLLNHSLDVNKSISSLTKILEKATENIQFQNDQISNLARVQSRTRLLLWGVVVLTILASAPWIYFVFFIR